MDKLVSVIMPVYNVKYRYLLTAIDSILNQPYSNIELIIVDSSDENSLSKSLLELNDIRLHYCFREKNGISDALNYGLEMAKGEYIARMDADDISLPLRLEKQITFLENHTDIDVIGTYFDTIDSNNNIFEQNSMIQAEDYETIKSYMIFDNPIAHPTVVFRKAIIDAGWRYRNVHAEDYDLWIRMLPSVKFANIGEKLLYYRQYGGNTSFQTSRYGIALEVARATQKYIKELFDINTAKYKDEDFSKGYITTNS